MEGGRKAPLQNESFYQISSEHKVCSKLLYLQMDKRKDPSSVDVKQVLLEMRKYRMGLIQTADQLRFSYLAVIEGAKFIMGDASVQVSAADCTGCSPGLSCVQTVAYTWGVNRIGRNFTCPAGFSFSKLLHYGVLKYKVLGAITTWSVVSKNLQRSTCRIAGGLVFFWAWA